MCTTSNENILCFLKKTDDLKNIVVVAVNLDPYHTHSAWVSIPLNKIELPKDSCYEVQDLITKDKFYWYGQHNYIELNPFVVPAHIFKIGASK